MSDVLKQALIFVEKSTHRFNACWQDRQCSCGRDAALATLKEQEPSVPVSKLGEWLAWAEEQQKGSLGSTQNIVGRPATALKKLRALIAEETDDIHADVFNSHLKEESDASSK